MKRQSVSIKKKKKKKLTFAFAWEQKAPVIAQRRVSPQSQHTLSPSIFVTANGREETNSE